MKPTEILKHIDELQAMQDYDGRYKAIYALLCSLPDKELMQYVETHGFSDIDMRIIARRGLGKRFLTRQKTAVNRLLTALASPSSTNKKQLREQLKSRYKHVPPSYRKRILQYMLMQKTKKERLWAYTRLGQQWDDSLSYEVDRCFVCYFEKECAWLIMNHFQSDYIYSFRNQLADLVGWRWVIGRLGREYPDIVDRSKLSPDDWVRVVVQLNLTEHRSDIEEYLYRCIASTVDSMLQDEQFYPRPTTLRDMPDVGYALWAMGQMGMADSVLRFAKYDRWLVRYPLPDDKDNAADEYRWLCLTYDTIAVGLLNWPSRLEQGHS